VKKISEFFADTINKNLSYLIWMIS